MFRSALLKLTAAYLSIVMAISLLFSVVLYHVTVQELRTGLHNQYLLWENQYQPFGLRLPTNPSEELAERSHNILMQLIYINLIILILSGIISYLLAKRSLQPIEAAHEQQKRFTADVSHELRTPLTAIKMESEVALLDKKARAADLRASLESNLEEVARMEELINNLLQLTTIEENKLREDFTRLRLDELVTSAAAAVQKHADAKHIELAIQAVPSEVVGDQASLRQLFVILLDNAIKYSPEHTTVHVTSRQRTTGAEVTITDQGVGIDKSSLPHVFDRFYRADKARSEQSVSGFGLGLSLAKLIADLHNGEIILTSTSGKGTQAVLRLPTAPHKK